MDHGLEIFTEYLIEALKTCQGWTYSDILRALGVVLYENGGKLSRVSENLLWPASWSYYSTVYANVHYICLCGGMHYAHLICRHFLCVCAQQQTLTRHRYSLLRRLLISEQTHAYYTWTQIKQLCFCDIIYETIYTAKCHICLHTLV